MLPEDPISSSIRDCGGVAVLTVSGDIDMASGPAFKSAIGEALVGAPQALVLDLHRVDFLGSGGVQILLEAQRRIGDAARFAVVANDFSAGRIFQLLSLEELLSVYETVEDALREVKSS